MKITVIIPAYNEEKYIQKTLESIKGLDRAPDEIILVDGGSSDKTVQVAKSYGAKIVVVKHRGIGLARNRGLKMATGDIVAFTDADTIVPNNWLTKIEECLLNPGVVGVFGLFKVHDGNWIYKNHINYIVPILIDVYYFFGTLMAPGQNMAFKRDVGLAAGGFPENFKIAEDIEMMMRLKKKGKVILRKDLVVVSSGRRGDEGPKIITRNLKAFFLYFFFKKANIIGFPDIR